MIEDARLGFGVAHGRDRGLHPVYAGLKIADDPKLPAWTPGDEFEAARKAALGAGK